MSCVILIGMPGAGKSTMGQALAARFNVGFVDTDDVLAVREGKSVAQLIKEMGVEKFARVESEVVEELQAHDCVIATGGSVVMHEAAMAHLKELGKIVFLDVSLREIAERVGDALARGVVGAHKMSMKEIYAMRRPAYLAQADLVVPNGTDEEIPEEALKKIREWLYG
jgi:shikimate kinase